MAFHAPQQVAKNAVEIGTKKAGMSIPDMLVLGFLAGAFIALGFLLDIRTIGNLPKEWGSFGSFLGGAVFPIGLMFVILAGGELLTGNMMTLPIAMLARRVTIGQIARNWFWITLANFAGAVFVAYFFGHVVGLTEAGPFLAKTVAIAEAKLHDSFFQAFVSAIGCNWLVCLGVWLAFASDDVASKILGIWFPVMAFVTIGFQHVVANMFVIPAAIFAGKVTWMAYLSNFVPVFLGNAVGGAVFVAGVYWFVYLRREKAVQASYHIVKKNA